MSLLSITNISVPNLKMKTLTLCHLQENSKIRRKINTHSILQNRKRSLRLQSLKKSKDDFNYLFKWNNPPNLESRIGECERIQWEVYSKYLLNKWIKLIFKIFCVKYYGEGQIQINNPLYPPFETISHLVPSICHSCYFSPLPISKY